MLEQVRRGVRGRSDPTAFLFGGTFSFECGGALAFLFGRALSFEFCGAFSFLVGCTLALELRSALAFLLGVLSLPLCGAFFLLPHALLFCGAFPLVLGAALAFECGGALAFLHGGAFSFGGALSFEFCGAFSFLLGCTLTLELRGALSLPLCCAFLVLPRAFLFCGAFPLLPGGALAFLPGGALLLLSGGPLASRGMAIALHGAVAFEDVARRCGAVRLCAVGRGAARPDGGLGLRADVVDGRGRDLP